VDGFKPIIPKKKKPRVGALPLEREPERYGPPRPVFFAVPPWHDPNVPHPQPEKERTLRKNFKKLKAAQKRVEELRAVIRDDAFDEWVRRCLTEAETPKEWTQSTVLYENYLKRAKAYGWNRPDRRLSKRELASETRFGILMRDVGIPKKRRAKGWFYPVRLKKGA
jgi:hypothetical protein